MADASSNPEPKLDVARADDVVTLLLDHPGKLNAITVAMWRRLEEVFRELGGDDSVRCVIVRGRGGVFAAGADIAEFPRERGDLRSVVRYHQEILAPALRAVWNCPHPVVAAIEGVCIGGGLEIVSQCDLRLAANSARFGAPISRLGFPMAPEELRAVLRLTGPVLAAELLFEGRILDAEEAFRRGVVTRVVPAEGFEDALLETIANIRRGGAQAARINKQTLRRLVTEAPTMNAKELEAFYALWAESAEHREGVAAFLEGRPPRF